MSLCVCVQGVNVVLYMSRCVRVVGINIILCSSQKRRKKTRRRPLCVLVVDVNVGCLRVIDVNVVLCSSHKEKKLYDILYVCVLWTSTSYYVRPCTCVLWT
jgi:hypothetical protein